MTTATRDMASLEKTLQGMQDIEQIKNVVVAYARALDGRDWSALRNCFTADAIIEGSIDTLPIDKVLERSQRLAVQYTVTMHYISNQTVELSGDTAIVDSYMMACHWKGATRDT